jgi:hypothetical protein
MMEPEDEAFSELEKAQQRKVATGMTNGELYLPINTPFYAFANSPQPVGAWVLCVGAPLTTKFMMYAKPTDEQIKNTEELLGWKWEDV